MQNETTETTNNNYLTSNDIRREDEARDAATDAYRAALAAGASESDAVAAADSAYVQDLERA